MEHVVVCHRAYERHMMKSLRSYQLMGLPYSTVSMPLMVESPTQRTTSSICVRYERRRCHDHLRSLPHARTQALVKSVSVGSRPPSAAFSQVQLPSFLMPQAQVDPVTLLFSLEALSHVHSPAGLAPMNQVRHTSKTCCHGHGLETYGMSNEHRRWNSLQPSSRRCSSWRSACHMSM